MHALSWLRRIRVKKRIIIKIMNQDILDNGDTGTGFYQSDQERGD